ncbi:MAG: shikimate dehydrogenase [Candidatus Sumerlaeaceae bacterium]|nr:shikimate dehydrogenase [Candidatus Sumerlaeaceae bacterium]
MQINAHTRMIGIIGYPVRHSLSPLMHNAEFRRLGLNLVYLAWEVAQPALPLAIRGLRALGAVGFNVTVPHKQAVVAELDELSEEAKVIGAVNTVRFENGRAVGYNTDAEGWREDAELEVPLKGATVSIIGAGGAARAVAVGACQAGAAKLIICNRRFETAETLGELIAHFFPHVQVSWSSLCGDRCRELIRSSQIVINATPIGMADKGGTPIPTEWLIEGQFVYDTIYTPAETQLLREARQRGCRVRNGIGMLVRQGAKAFELWTGLKPDIQSMIATVEHALSTSTTSHQNPSAVRSA